MRSLTLAAIFSILLAVHPHADVASSFAQESVRPNDVVLQCALAKDGEIVARPALRITSGQSGSFSYRDELTATLTATRLDANRVRLALTIEAAGKTIKPEIKLGDQDQGTVSFPAGKATYKFRFSLGG